MISQTVTRNDGDFHFSGLEVGEYEVAVVLAGYQPATELVRFKLPPGMGSRGVLNVEIILRPRVEALLSSPGVSFAQEVPKRARSAYERAITQLRAGKSADAIALLREAIAEYDDYFDAHYYLGAELYRAGQYDAALLSLERARQINDRESAVYYVFGLVMVKQQKYGVAEYAFREAVRHNANSAPARFYRGAVLIEIALRTGDEKQRETDLADAERELSRALELSSDKLAAAHLQLYRIHERRGDRPAAIHDLENYLKAEPDAGNAAEIRAKITKLRGK
jgi:tetratricopeptide (TPR) repeat protein